jgi:hypothetical protein
MAEENNYPNPIRRTISDPSVYLNMVRSIHEYIDYIDYVNTMVYINNIEEKIIEEVSNSSMNECNLQKKKNVNLLIKKEKLKIKNFSENTKCCICISDFEVNEEVGITNCSHIFHYDCLIEWGKYKTTCPLCLHTIPFDNINKEVQDDSENTEVEEHENQEVEEHENQEVEEHENQEVEEHENKEVEEHENEQQEEGINENMTILMSITNCSEEEALYSMYINGNLENAILYLCQ